MRKPAIASHNMPAANTLQFWLLVLSTAMSLLGALDPERASAQSQSVPACTPQSLSAYQQLAAQMHRGGDFPTAALGKVVGQKANPIIVLTQASASVAPGAYDYADDPSCGLAPALATCKQGRPRERLGASSFCRALRPHAVIGFLRPLAHRMALTIYHRVGPADPATQWRLVQNALLPHDAELAMPAGDTLRIEFAQRTVHEIWRWERDAFVPLKRWRTVWLWHAGRYVSRPLDHSGELSGASPDCGIGLVRRILNQATEEWLRHAAQTPPLYLYCGHLAGDRNLQELSFAVWDTPSAGDMPWLVLAKDSHGQWVAEDEPYVLVGTSACLAPTRAGFVTSDQVWDDDPGCHGMAPCYRFERHRWTGHYYIVSSTRFSPSPDPTCNH